MKWKVQQVTEARELELRSGPSYTLGLHSVTADAVKLDKISEGGLGGGQEQRVDSWSSGTHHCPRTGGIQEAAAREKGGMPESHCIPEHQEERGFEEESGE